MKGAPPTTPPSGPGIPTCRTFSLRDRRTRPNPQPWNFKQYSGVPHPAVQAAHAPAHLQAVVQHHGAPTRRWRKGGRRRSPSPGAPTKRWRKRGRRRSPSPAPPAPPPSTTPPPPGWVIPSAKLKLSSYQPPPFTKPTPATKPTSQKEEEENCFSGIISLNCVFVRGKMQ